MRWSGYGVVNSSFIFGHYDCLLLPYSGSSLTEHFDTSLFILFLCIFCCKVYTSKNKYIYAGGHNNIRNTDALTSKTLKYFLHKPWRPKGCFQFKISINGLVSFFCFIWKPMLWVYGNYIYWRQILTLRVDPRTVRDEPYRKLMSTTMICQCFLQLVYLYLKGNIPNLSQS